MKIYETAVRKPISTILIFVGVIVFGLFSLNNLAVDQYPDIEIPQIAVITSYAGANAADIETNITRVLEDNLNTVENLKKMTSKSSDNFSMITLEFEYGSDLTEAANDIRDAVSRTQSLLPDDVDYPTIFKFSSSMIPVMMLAVTADESYPALNKILDDKLVNDLNRINGVGSVSVMGVPEREVQVNVDPAKLEAYNLTVEQLGQIIAAENVNIPSGTIDIGNNTFNIKADGEFSDASTQLGKVVLSNRNGRKVLLNDVAEIRDTLEKATMDERVNGQLGVRVIIQKQSGANTVDIVHEVQRRLPAIAASLPGDVDIELIYEGSQEITDAIGSLSETIMYAFIFVVLVVMIFLGRWRATFIICLTIPVSLICSFIYLYAVGSTLNIISLSSLSIAIGMVVDDAIVVLENITTHIERGSQPKEAAIYATNEVWLSVIATTLVTVAGVLPLAPGAPPAADAGVGPFGHHVPRVGLDRIDRGERFDGGGHFADPDVVGLHPAQGGRRTRLQGSRHRLQADRSGAHVARRRLCTYAGYGAEPPSLDAGGGARRLLRLVAAAVAGAVRVLPACGQRAYCGYGASATERERGVYGADRPRDRQRHPDEVSRSAPDFGFGRRKFGRRRLLGHADHGVAHHQLQSASAAFG